jgi:glycosyltransferase A (GT-A) superfamily protein (DUF2064 family)
MANALALCCAEGGHGVVVGTDCPPVDATYVRRAAEALTDTDVVLGPALDGGYGLVATRQSMPQIFRDVPWGTDAVLRATLAQAARAGFSVRVLDSIWDVDSASDWNRYLQHRKR